MTHYYLGVDVGATKSHALVADEAGRPLGTGVAGAGNYENVGFDGLTEVLHALTGQALVAAGLSRTALSGAGFGIAGYDWPGEYAPTMQAIQSLRLTSALALENDTLIGLLAGAEAGWGVAVVAGTSNNCWGRDRRRRVGRMAGGGPQLGEFAGAREVVGKAVQEVSRAWSLRGPATQLTAAFVEWVGAQDATDLIEGIALGRYHVEPAAAPLVFKAAELGDAVAQGIIYWAGCELGSLVNGVIRQLELQNEAFDVVLIGSLFKGSPVLSATMSDAVHAVASGAHLKRLSAPPVVGGVLLGMESAGVDYAAVRRALIDAAATLF